MAGGWLNIYGQNLNIKYNIYNIITCSFLFQSYVFYKAVVMRI